jgi:hypothetical protein
MDRSFLLDTVRHISRVGSEDNVMNVSLLGKGGKVKISCRMFQYSEVKVDII